MKTKVTHSPLYWIVTMFMVLTFCQPRLLQSAPSTNSITATSSVDQSPAPKQEKIWFLIVALIGIVVVGYILYQIVKMASRITPPDPPPVPPTNSPPVVINPKGSPGPAGSISLTSILPRPSLDTNQPAWGEFDCYDITTLNYKDVWAVPTSLFTHYWSTGMTISTNLVDWEDSHYRIDAFISDTGTFFAYFHYETNYYNCYFTDSAKACAYFDLSDHPAKRAQFFRLKPR